MSLDDTRPSDFVDNPRLPGCALVRQSLVTATLTATGMLAAWLVIGLLTPGGLAEIDHRVLAILHNVYDPNDPIGPDWLESVMRDLTSLGSNIVVIVITAAAAAVLAMMHRRGPAILLTVTILATFLLNAVLKSLFDRARPDFLAPSIDVETSSFPSSHAMLSAVLYLLLAAIAAREIADRRLATALIVAAALLAFVVGATRVYLGAHWPSDVLAGWLLGAAVALASWQLARSPTSPEPERRAAPPQKDDLPA
ncbi:MAG: phosphatase PAP2 family protein [Hyphomicrobiaceae bacterium]